MSLKDISAILREEPEAIARLSELRRRFHPSRFNDVRAFSQEHALRRGVEIIQGTLKSVRLRDIKIEDIDPGHSIGHLARDYVNALLLPPRLPNIAPSHLLVGFVGGVLHDIGNAIVPRYEESRRIIRHAEAGALLFEEAAKTIDLNEAERELIAYAIAAHTHYLKPFEITRPSGSHMLLPYKDTDEDGKPLFGVWMPRWIDRLDCNGPTFPGRHYLTLTSPREEFDGREFYRVDFNSTMQPLLRADDAINAVGGKRTMLEHLAMFAASQTNNSPYGKHDYGSMVEMRDAHTALLRTIIGAVYNPSTFSHEAEYTIQRAWTVFLGTNIEPTSLGKRVAQKLEDSFGSLDEKARNAWTAGFAASLRTYAPWASEKLEQLRGAHLSPTDLILRFGSCDYDVRDILNPTAQTRTAFGG